jgi:hypothetical protein
MQPRRSLVTLIACAFSLSMLTACVTSSGARVDLPPMPADLPACFQRLVKAPTGKTLTQKQVFRLIADLRRSEVEKANCGARALAFYDDVRAGLAEGRAR